LRLISAFEPRSKKQNKGEKLPILNGLRT